MKKVNDRPSVTGYPTVSVVCPVLNEERYIYDCIKGMIQQDYPADLVEYIFVDGGSEDSTLDIINSFRILHKNIKLARNDKRIIPVGMNIGISLASGEIIIRIDAHSMYPENYISSLVRGKLRLSADNVGGVCITLPSSDTDEAKGIAIALSTLFGMGNSRFRIGASDEMEVDTVPFGCYDREYLISIGGYDERFERNQDDELNGRIKRDGGKIWLLPDVEIKYYPRDSIMRLWKMWYGYGLYKPMVGKKLGSPATFRQLIPPLFVISLFSFLIVVLVTGMYSFLLVIMILWLVCALCSAITQSRNIRVVAWSVLAYLTVHLSYGIGYLAGLNRLSEVNKG